MRRFCVIGMVSPEFRPDALRGSWPSAGSSMKRRSDPRAVSEQTAGRAGAGTEPPAQDCAGDTVHVPQLQPTASTNKPSPKREIREILAYTWDSGFWDKSTAQALVRSEVSDSPAARCRYSRDWRGRRTRRHPRLQTSAVRRPAVHIHVTTGVGALVLVFISQAA